MDSFFPTYTQQAQSQQLQPPAPPQQQQQHHQGLCNNDKINMNQSEFECFPQAVASIPLENLSLDQHMSNEWPLELRGGDDEYQADINCEYIML
ncbi:hypothetical protein G6F42_028996 [Rhizopus arrhizus]|nr:hypothetical protein G6F42_028996 [Rhizopus arrhizus]